MRPRLHTDTFYMPVADGVYVRNNRSNITIKGKIVYNWLENLVPYCNGLHELEEITDGLDASRKAMVTDLVETLCNNRFLSDASLDRPHTLSKEELTTYASEIAFIESFQSSAAWCFETYRQMRLLVIGAGIAFSACMRSCLHSGIAHLSMIRTTEEEPVPEIDSIIDTAKFFLPRDSAQHVQEILPPDWDDRNETLNTIRPFDAIIHISDRPMLARTRLLNALCVEQQKIFIQVCFVRNHAWIGPLVKPGTEGCWECAWRRLQSNIQDAEQLPYYALEDQNAMTSSLWFAFPAAAIAANQLVFTLFKSVVLAEPPECAFPMISFDLETLTSKSHPFLPHLHCQSCQYRSAPAQSSFLRQIELLEQQQPLDRTTFSKQAVRCFNDNLGIFRSIDEGNFEQIPLAVCKVETSNPAVLYNQAQAQSIIALGIDYQSARQRATQKACEVYASKAVDPRLLVTQIPAPDMVLSPECFLTAGHSSTIEAWSWALHLYTGQPRLIPATLAFPVLQSREPGEADQRGIGSGMSWPEALCQALLDWACYLTLAQFKDRQDPYPKINLHSISWTPEGKYLFSLATTAGLLPDIYDITSSLGVPTFAVSTKEQTFTYVSHCDARQALNAGLERSLQQFQSHEAQQPEFDINPGPPLPLALRSDQYSALQDSPVSEEWSARLVWIQQRFQEQGWYALAVPLSHDSALTQVCPFLVRVLLMREESEK